MIVDSVFWAAPTKLARLRLPDDANVMASIHRPLLCKRDPKLALRATGKVTFAHIQRVTDGDKASKSTAVLT